MKEPLFTVASLGDERQALLCPWEISREDMGEIERKFKAGESLEQIADEMNERYPSSRLARFVRWLRRLS